MSLIIDDPGNTFKIKQIWAVVSEDEEGNEGICGFPIEGMGAMPLIGADDKRVADFEKIIPLLKKHSNKKIKLVKFSVREDVKIY